MNMMPLNLNKYANLLKCTDYVKSIQAMLAPKAKKKRNTKKEGKRRRCGGGGRRERGREGEGEGEGEKTSLNEIS